MLWGPPGIGKSDSIKQIAEYIQFKANKKVCITDVRLNLFNPIDLRGIPTSNADKTLAIWLKPQIFQISHFSISFGYLITHIAKQMRRSRTNNTAQ